MTFFMFRRLRMSHDNQARPGDPLSEGGLYKGIEAPKGDGSHSGPLADLAKYKALGTSGLIGDRLCPCAATNQIKTRQGDRFAQAALRSCGWFG
jgi:hypothetical protein